MDAFFASIEQADNPSLRGKAVAVIGAEDRTVVLTASYEAKRLGVKTGATVYEAKKKCPWVTFVIADIHKYMRVSKKIMKILKDFTPIVEICSIDEAFLDITGMNLIFSSVKHIAEQIKQRVKKQFGITCSIGVAPNKLLAKLAANMKKPDGFVRITSDVLPEFMSSVPVDKICGIGPKTTKFLHNRGILTCGDLQKIPAAYLKSKFGIVGEWLHNAAFGNDSSPVIPFEDEEQVKSIGHSMTLKEDALSRDEVRTHLEHLSEMVGRRLRSANLVCRTVCVQIRFSSFNSIHKRKTFYDEFFTGEDIFRAATEVWEKIKMSEPVRLVGISVSNLREKKYQMPIFEDERRKFKITIAKDKINDYFGEFTIFPAAILNRNTRERTIAPSWRPDGVRQAIRE